MPYFRLFVNVTYHFLSYDVRIHTHRMIFVTRDYPRHLGTQSHTTIHTHTHITYDVEIISWHNTTLTNWYFLFQSDLPKYVIHVHAFTLSGTSNVSHLNWFRQSGCSIVSSKKIHYYLWRNDRFYAIADVAWLFKGI